MPYLEPVPTLSENPMHRSDFEKLARIAEVLQHHNAYFVVIGGFAIEAQYPHLGYRTRDIDFTPEASVVNLDRVSQALYELNARVRHGDQYFAFNHDGSSLSRASVWNLVCDYGAFDLSLQPTSMGDYDDIIANAQLVSIAVGSSTIEIPCASLAAITASKEALSRDKDQLILPLLHDQLEADRSAEPPTPGFEL